MWNVCCKLRPFFHRKMCKLNKGNWHIIWISKVDHWFMYWRVAYYLNQCCLGVRWNTFHCNCHQNTTIFSKKTNLKHGLHNAAHFVSTPMSYIQYEIPGACNSLPYGSVIIPRKRYGVDLESLWFPNITQLFISLSFSSNFAQREYHGT